MKEMFYSAMNFNQEINFDTSQVRNMMFMFAYAYEFNNGGKQLRFDTNRVETVKNMFAYASEFNNCGKPLTLQITSLTKERQEAIHSMFKDSKFNQKVETVGCGCGTCFDKERSDLCKGTKWHTQFE